MECYRIHMGKAKCAVDLGDGSERGEYVNQDYILSKLGRPHRSISLMSALHGIFPMTITSPIRADWAAAPRASRSSTCGRSAATDRMSA